MTLAPPKAALIPQDKNELLIYLGRPYATMRRRRRRERLFAVLRVDRSFRLSAARFQRSKMLRAMFISRRCFFLQRCDLTRSVAAVAAALAAAPRDACSQ